jgi:hypothetical protein
MSLATRFVDLINPVVLRESRQLVRSRFAVGILMTFLIIMSLSAGAFVVMTSDDRMALDHGQSLFAILSVILGYASLLFIPAHTALPLLMQKQSAGMDLLFVSTIPPRSIIWGKMASAFWMMVLMFSVSMPFMVLTIQLRGIGLFDVFASLAIQACLILIATMGFLLLVCLPVSRVFAILLSIGYFFMLFIFPSTLSVGLAYSGINATGLWITLGISTVLLLIGGALATALISPAITNRYMGPRITATACWILIGIIGAFPKTNVAEPWAATSSILAALAILAACSEPSTMSRRVHRSVPKNPGLRFLSFPFFTGGLNGMLWALTIGLISAAFMKSDFLEFASFILYMLMYSLLAIRIRTLPGIARIFPEKHTWALAALLTILGTLLPIIAHFIVHPDRGPHLLWPLGNPFVAFDEDPGMHVTYALFASLILFLTNIRWVLSQVAGFRPIHPTPPASETSR